MCHLILLLPLLALPVFWLIPQSAAIPVYIAVLIVSGGAYYLAFRSVRAGMSGSPNRPMRFSRAIGWKSSASSA